MHDSLHPDEYGLIQLGSMRLGMVAPARLEQRRANPRAMGSSEYAALRKSVERFGFKSFIVAEELSPGHYGVVDGHHRLRLAVESGMDRVPIVLLDEQEQPWTDLAMLSFNVTGKPQSEPYIDLLAELTRTLGTEITAEFTAVNDELLKSLTADLDAAMAAMAEDEEKRKAEEAGASSSGSAWQGRPIVVEIPRTPENLALLAQIREASGEPTDSQAILAILRSWVELSQELVAHSEA